MEGVRTSETSVDNHFTRQYNPQDNSEYETRQVNVQDIAVWYAPKVNFNDSKHKDCATSDEQDFIRKASIPHLLLRLICGPHRAIIL
jgi:hypothetical protein